MTSVSCVAALRAATRPLHGRIEETPYARALVAGAPSLTAYLGHLRALAVIHAAVERHLDTVAVASGPAAATIRAVWRPELRRYPLLLEDLEHFRYRLEPDVPAAVEAALHAASDVRLRSGTDPVGLLGALYVLEGSRRGAAVLAPRVAEALDLAPGRGLSYLADGAREGDARWEAVAGALDAHLASDADRAAAVAGAVALFEHLHAAFAALAPIEPDALGYRITSLNPESGVHPMPQSRSALLAVLRASDRCLGEIPYFVARYGARGRRFTDADGAWLATLPANGPEALEGQVDWLASVLAARGMPSRLLARHLEILADELTDVGEGEDDGPAQLAAAAARLRRRSDERLPPAAADRIARSFGERAGLRTDDAAAREAGALLVAAVADEALGYANAVPSVLDWLADASRFAPGWIAAAEATVAAAREALRA